MKSPSPFWRKYLFTKKMKYHRAFDHSLGSMCFYYKGSHLMPERGLLIKNAKENHCISNGNLNGLIVYICCLLENQTLA